MSNLLIALLYCASFSPLKTHQSIGTHFAEMKQTQTQIDVCYWNEYLFAIAMRLCLLLTVVFLCRHKHMDSEGDALQPVDSTSFLYCFSSSVSLLPLSVRSNFFYAICRVIKWFSVFITCTKRVWMLKSTIRQTMTIKRQRPNKNKNKKKQEH